ncbi:MAG: Membrane protein insertase YidC [Gemmatimonadetes bacterium]|nr:Membrane protein insertase YidC [Gemmatimonadota bacterium]
MDNKRFMVALLLTTVVLLLTQRFFAPKPPVQAPVATSPAASAVASGVIAGAPAGQATTPAQTVTVRSPLYEYRFSTRGAALTGAELTRYASYVKHGSHVQLVPEGATDVLAHRVAAGRDTVDLRGAAFQPSAARLDLPAGGKPQTLTFRYGAAGGVQALVTYTFRPDSYLVGIRGTVTGVPAGGALLTDLGTGLAHHDAREHGSAQELSVAGWNGDKLSTRLLAKVEGSDTIPGPLSWAAVKDRYFMMALLADQGSISELLVQDAPDFKTTEGTGDKAEPITLPRALTTAVSPLGAGGSFAFTAYLGPQEHSRLVAAGHGLDEVNPYGYAWLRPVVRPIAAFILWVLNLAHERWSLSYGWLLILAGVAMRAITWPLNAKAMRAQMKNMEKQPILQAKSKEIQEKYKDDPAQQQAELFKLYKEMDFSPVSMFTGCLPMLIPMPVLITLFFVFRSAIEFRGTGFWWFPDLSLADPLHILPVFLVLSMFGLQWVSTRMSGMEANPQTTMMMYMMPLMMGFLFFRFPSGLNLYYATTNLASLPQQVLIARERRRLAAEKKKEDALAKAEARASSGGHPGTRRVKRRR